MPQINARGLALIKEFEGCELSAYPDPGTGGEPWTIGYGHTGDCAAISLGTVAPGMAITQEQADALLRADLASFERGVNALCSRAINSNQFSALVSFAYNLGLGALANSSLMRCVNAGDFAGADARFGAWVYADGAILPGLVRRRAAEAALFASP